MNGKNVSGGIILRCSKSYASLSRFFYKKYRESFVFKCNHNVKVISMNLATHDVECTYDMFQGTKLMDEQKTEHFRSLHDLGVELNQYVRSLTPRPDKITRIVAQEKAANLHLHHS